MGLPIMAPPIRLSRLLMIAIVVMLLYYTKKHRMRTQLQLRNDGYRRCDISAQLYGIAQEMGASPTVSGFEVCSDAFTVEHAKEVGRGLMRSFINFRSQIHKIGDEWYYKEAFDPETSDMNEYIDYVEMKSNPIFDDESISRSNEEIEEILFQEALDYLNHHSAFNVKWNEYERAHFDGIYLHFKAQNKVILFFRFDHSLCDGILMSTLLTLIHHQLFNPLHSYQPIDFSKEQEVAPMLSEAMDHEPRSFNLFQRINHYMHCPVALGSFCKYNILSVIRPDTQCAFRGEFEPKNKLALSRPIKVSLFKSIAHFYGGTVNDLFLALSIGSMRRYAEKSGCPIFNDPGFEGVFSKLSVVNRRSLEPSAFAKELKVFAEKGTNANALDFTPFRVNVKTINLENAQNAFRPIKEGYSAKVFRSAVEAMGNIPGGRKAMVQLNQIITMCSSNMRGPKELIPIPGEEGKEQGFVSWFFGIAIPGPLPVNFGLVTYKEAVRIGAIVNTGSIADPKLLMECYMEEWQEYARYANVTIA